MYECTECGNISSVNYKCCELCGNDDWEYNAQIREIEILSFLKQLEKVWLKYPELRFGQLIYYIMSTNHQDIFYISDEDWKKRINMRCIRDK